MAHEQGSRTIPARGGVHPRRAPHRCRARSAISAPAIVLAVLLVVTACTPDDDGDAGAPPDDPDAGAPADDPDAGAPADDPDAGAPADDTALGGFDAIPDLIREVAPSTVSIEFAATQAGQVLEGGGSGVVWDADGIVVTNDHVVAPADDLHVVLGDGTRYEAEVIAGDPRTDIAVLRIDATDLPAATFDERLPEIGEIAVALGNPLGFQNTATAGIVSGVDRSLPIVPDAPPLVGLIQTDAAISSGNSGGALVNGSGQVIGINVAAVDDAAIPGVAQGLGFAIPSSTVIAVVEQLLEHGEVAHAHLGIRGATLTPQLAERFGLDAERGVLIGEAQPDGPAEEAGLQQGMVIVEVDGEPIDDLGALFAVLQRAAPGDTVPVTTIDEDGAETTVDVTLAERPDEEPVVIPSS